MVERRESTVTSENSRFHDARKEKFLVRCETTAQALVRWAGEDLPKGMTVFGLPASHRLRLRTTNLLELGNEDIPQRTPVVRLFPNVADCLRLVSAVLRKHLKTSRTPTSAM